MIRLVRRSLALGLVVATVLASSGIVLVVQRPHPAPAYSDEWFPCKAHLCGCVSAEMCRTSCCCDKKEIRAAATLAKGGCCSHHDEAQTSVALSIRSPGCSGGTDFQFVKASFWIVPFARFEPRLFVNPSRPAVLSVAIPKSESLLPDHPPPRDC